MSWSSSPGDKSKLLSMLRHDLTCPWLLCSCMPLYVFLWLEALHPWLVNSSSSFSVSSTQFRLFCFCFLHLRLFIFINSFLLLLCYSCPNFLPLPSSTHPTPFSHSQSPHRCPCPCPFIHVLCLVPSPFFHHYPPPPPLLVTFSLFHVSMPVVLFCYFTLFIRFLL